jgi:hypothetical protein
MQAGRLAVAIGLLWVAGYGDAQAQSHVFGQGGGQEYDLLPGDETRAGTWFISPIGAIGHIALPKWRANYIVSQNFQTLFGNPIFKPEFTVSGGGLTLGYAFPRRKDVPSSEGRVRLYLTLGTWKGSSDESRVSNISGADQVTVYTVSGSRRFNLSFIDFSPPEFLFQRLRVSLLAVDSTLRISKDFRISPKWTLTPALGIFGGHQFLRYRYDAYLTDSAGRSRFPYREDQSVSSYHAGGLASLRVRWWLSPNFALHLTGMVGGFYRHARVRASDCFSDAFADKCVASSLTTSSQDSGGKIGVRAAVTMGVEIRFKRFVLQLSGFVSADTATAVAQNGDGVVRLPSAEGDSRLMFHPTWVSGGMITLRIPFRRRR